MHTHLGGMVAIPHYFLWRLQWDATAAKYMKTPCALDGSVFRIDASKPANWCDFTTAQATLAKLQASPRADGLHYALGFWLTAECHYWFLDLDKALGADGQWLPAALQLLAQFPGAMVEVSSSGAGLHVIGRGHAPTNHRNKPTADIAAMLAPMQLEFYTASRGIAFGLTQQAQGCADTACDIGPLCATYFPARAVQDAAGEGPRPEWRGPADDAALRERMLAAKQSAASAFGSKVSLQQLLRGECTRSSENDAALASHLAWWTGCDAERMERMMRASPMRRAKWDTHATYLAITIASAIANCTGTYQEPLPLPLPQAPVTTTNVRTGAALMQRAFAPVQWAVHGLIPQGTEILSAPPKAGKSWLVLQACIAVAAGVPIWHGRDPEVQGDTLYLDLEGNDRRLQERIAGLLKSFPEGTALDRFHYDTEWPRAEDGVVKLREWLTAHPGARMVIIDTLASFRDPDPGRKSAYMADYAVGEMLKPLTREFPIAIVVVTHTRKMGATDAMDKISGTQGLVGGVDNYMILSRSTGNMDAELVVNGRDIREPLELALRTVKDGGWTCIGNSSDIKRSDERTDVIRSLVSLGGVGTSRDIHAALDAPVGMATLYKRLARMVKAGEILKDGKLFTVLSMTDASNLTPPPIPGQ